MGETRILPTHDKRNPLVLIFDSLLVAGIDLTKAMDLGMVRGEIP